MDDLAEFLKRFYGRQGTSPFGPAQPWQQQRNNTPITLSEKTRRFVISEFDLESDNSLFGHTTKTIMDEQGPKIIETATAYKGACGHLIGLNEQNIASGTCGLCGKLLCSQCSSTRCIKCNSMICNRCTAAIDDEVFCINCCPSRLWRKIALPLLQYLHKMLSKEF